MPSSIVQIPSLSDFWQRVKALCDETLGLESSWSFGPDGQQATIDLIDSQGEVQWFYYTDHFEGIKLRLYDRRYRHSHANTYVYPRMKNPESNDFWVIIYGHDLGTEGGDLKTRLRAEISELIVARDRNVIEGFPRKQVERCDWFERENGFDASKLFSDLRDILDFTPRDEEDARRRINQSIALRQGQGRFRRDALAAYERRCPITLCDVEEALEAAHVIPFNGTATDRVENSLLIRADIHTLFDRRLLRIDPDTLTVSLDGIQGEAYQQLNGRALDLPEDFNRAALSEALRRTYRATAVD